MPLSGNDETGGHGGDLTSARRKWQPAGGELIDFSSNINPLGPPPGLKEHLARSLSLIASYPEPQARELRRELAAFLHVPVERLVVGNGASELIHLLILKGRPRRVLVPAPAFSEYSRAARLSGAEVIYYPLLPGEESLPHDAVSGLKAGDLFIFCNPHSPTGRLYRRSELLPLVESAGRKGAAVMIDESFIHLSESPEESLCGRPGGLFWVVMSLTKIWALPGLRLGCAVGPADEAAEITRWGDPWRVNALAQQAGLFCLKDKTYLEESLALIKNERLHLTKWFRDKGYFRVYDSAANYLLLEALDPGFDVALFQDCLARRGVLIRRADNFRGLNRRHFRIAVLNAAANRRLLCEIERWQEEHSPPGRTEAGRGGH